MLKLNLSQLVYIKKQKFRILDLSKMFAFFGTFLPMTSERLIMYIPFDKSRNYANSGITKVIKTFSFIWFILKDYSLLQMNR